jgi:hypothetical protein
VLTSCKLSRVSSSAGFCPVARRTIHLDSDYKRIIRIGLTVDDAGMRVEIATDGPNGNRLIGLPNPLRHNSGTVGTYVDCGCEFEGWMAQVIKIHKHLHRNTRFLPAQGGRLCQRFLRAGRSRTWKPTCASLGSNGTEGQRPVGLVSANPTRVEWRRRVTRWEKTSDPTILDCCRGGFPSAPTPWLDGHCGPEPWSSWFTVQLIYKGL